MLIDTINSRVDYKCKHIKRLRNDRNLGMIGTFNRLVAESSGDLLVINEGDDISHANRLARLVYYWGQAETGEKNVLASMSSCDIMNAQMKVVRKKPFRMSYHVEDGYDFLEDGLHHLGAVAAYSRKLWDKFGPIDPEGKYADLIMFFRAAISGAVLKIDESLMNYRCEGGMSTSYRTSLAKSRLSNEQLGHSLSQMQRDLVRCKTTLSVAQYEKIENWIGVRKRKQELLHVLMGHSLREKLKCWGAVKGMMAENKSNIVLCVFYLPEPFVAAISWVRGVMGNIKRYLEVNCFGDRQGDLS